jgi:lysophospholipase L1-like esterase
MVNDRDLYVLALLAVGLPLLAGWGYTVRLTIRFRQYIGQGGKSSSWQRAAASLLLGCVLFTGILVISIGPLWFRASVALSAIRRAEIRAIEMAVVVYGTAVVLAALALGPLLLLAIKRRTPAAARSWTARCLVLTLAMLVAAGIAEAVAVACLWANSVPMPWLPVKFEDQSDEHVVDILMIGESSALGVPYDAWFSVADIVAWKLGEAFPRKEFRLVNQAVPGQCLQAMHTKLAGIKRRPELVIIYAGHNEFQARFSPEDGALHYADLTPPPGATLASLARRVSPLFRLMEETAQKLSISIAPSRMVTRRLVDVPVYTAKEFSERVNEFRTRLGAIVSYCEWIGAQVVLVIPPGNDAGFEPNRSFLSPDTGAAEREEFAGEFLAARRAESTSPQKAEEAYRRLLQRQPGFAETHFRLARLLEQTGKWDEAYQHYAAARDLDGMPMRLPSQFHQVYREVAARHPRAILVDGPAELRAVSDQGIIGDVFFTDGLHPSLNGYTVLAQTILTKLHERRALNWPADSPAPLVTPLDCANHFQMDLPKWRYVCSYSAWYYMRTAYIRHDPTERLAKSDRYGRGTQQLDAGTPVEAVGIPGLGPRLEIAGDRRN